MFDVHMIFRYLYSQNKPHVIEYLMNKMFREYRNDVKILDFYLPQLCYMSITKTTKELSIPLERFIL